MATANNNNHRFHLIAVTEDLVMMILIIANLALILFDWLFGIGSVQQLLATHLPRFHDFYLHRVHAHFSEYDLWFVAVYLVEFTLQWIVAIWRKTYHRWFFYPFIHWYDLLGCIPVGDFRWLRVLRVFSILLRLQQLGWIDLRETYPGRIVMKYYGILVEEISDRIVINVLNGVQHEVTLGSPMLERLQTDVIAPRKEAILDMVSDQLVVSVTAAHQAHRSDLESYLARITDELLRHSAAGRQLRALPVAGKQIQQLIRHQVQQLGLALVDRMAADISDEDNRHYLNEIMDSFLERKGETPLTPLLQDIIQDVIEQIKAQVAVQQWKLEEAKEKATADTPALA